MAYNPAYYYPQTYQPQMFQPQIPQASPQMSLPTIHADIVQVEGEQAAASYPVGVGASQMMISRDDSTIFVKTALANGHYTLDVYEKRAVSAQAAPFNPDEYIRKDEAEQLVETILAAHSTNTRGKREVEHESV